MKELERWLELPEHSQTDLAKRIGVTQGAISQWLKNGCVPHRRVRAVERETLIPASKLNPDFSRRQPLTEARTGT